MYLKIIALQSFVAGSIEYSEEFVSYECIGVVAIPPCTNQFGLIRASSVRPESRSQIYVQTTGPLGWGVNTDHFINGVEEFLLSGNCLTIRLGGLVIGLLGLIMSLEFVWT